MENNEESQGDSDKGKSEGYPITCAKCGKESTVPFKPDGTRAVYCRDCFQEQRKQRSESDK